jgi:uncharacterized membrane protein
MIQTMGNTVFLQNVPVESADRWTPLFSLGIMGEVHRKGIIYGAADGEDAVRRFWDFALDELVLWLALLAILIAIACYIIGKIRPKSVQKEQKTSQWLAKCRELHSQGELSDEEFRTIKTTLASQLEDELKDNGDTG